MHSALCNRLAICSAVLMLIGTRAGETARPGLAVAKADYRSRLRSSHDNRVNNRARPTRIPSETWLLPWMRALRGMHPNGKNLFTSSKMELSATRDATAAATRGRRFVRRSVGGRIPHSGLMLRGGGACLQPSRRRQIACIRTQRPFGFSRWHVRGIHRTPLLAGFLRKTRPSKLRYVTCLLVSGRCALGWGGILRRSPLHRRLDRIDAL